MAFGITIVVRPFSIHGLLLASTGSATSSRIGCSSTARTRKNSPSSMRARGTIASCWGCTAFKFAQRRGATMSRLNLVERELGQLDGGSFQKLAETYVYRKLHLKSITALGSQPVNLEQTRQRRAFPMPIVWPMAKLFSSRLPLPNAIRSISSRAISKSASLSKYLMDTTEKSFAVILHGS